MKLKQSYVVVNAHLIPKKTARLVITQSLGKISASTHITIKPNEDPAKSIDTLLAQADKAAIDHPFSALQIYEMLIKLKQVSADTPSTFEIVIAVGEQQPLLYIERGNTSSVSDISYLL